VVLANFRFETLKTRLTPKELAELQAAVHKLQKSDALLITFAQRGMAHLAAGRTREALDELGKLVGLHPQETLHRAQIARALLAGGMGEAAREEARRAVAIDPQSAFAQKTLGWILQHDLLGRRFRAGFDWAAAVAAYRKAKALDGDDHETRADLAILLEHD